MVVDTSVLVAIALKEAGYERYVLAMAEADRRLISAASYMEASIVLINRLGEAAAIELDRTVAGLEMEIVPVTAAQARIGWQAHIDLAEEDIRPSST